jgi:hypothetical protein
VQNLKDQITFDNQPLLVCFVGVRVSRNDQNTALPMPTKTFLSAELAVMDLFSVFFYVLFYLPMPSIKLYFTLKNKMYSSENAFAVVSAVFV